LNVASRSSSSSSARSSGCACSAATRRAKSVLAEEQPQRRVGGVAAEPFVDRQHVLLLVGGVAEQALAVAVEGSRGAREVAVEQRDLVREEPAVEGRMQRHHAGAELAHERPPRVRIAVKNKRAVVSG
jgi:hypothetical protein